MASYSTMNTVPAADVESETPLQDCNQSGGFFGNVCLVHGTECAGHCAKRD